MDGADAIRGSRYEDLISNLPYGKMLPSAIYLHRNTEACKDGALGRLLSSLAQAHQVSDSFNVVKFRRNVARISFLCYPEFIESPHPALEESLSIDLATDKSFRIGYRDNINPPILHRKELFLSPDHPQWPLFASLSADEEKAGLFENSSLIGFRLNWERLLESRGLALDGHRLVSYANVESENHSQPPLTPISTRVERHRTALTRHDLSKPVKTLLEFEQLQAGHSFFDYGCGLGADVRTLKELGYEATGWDPVHAPEKICTSADIVNLGYVLNVIEDPAERIETLMNAWRLTRLLLVVSAQIGDAAANAPHAMPFNDGVLTSRNTFQRYFGQKEFQQYIEDALEVPAVPVAVGIFYVFKSPTDLELFMQSRSRRKVVWKDLGIDLGTPNRVHKVNRSAENSRPPARSRFDPILTHRDLVEQFWSCILTLGRLPLPTEFVEYPELCRLFGSAKRALRYVLKVNGSDLFTRAEGARRADLLVYLATAPLRRIVPFSLLPESTRNDIQTFFGSYKSALAEGSALLRSLGDLNNIALACDETDIGWQDEKNLYVHTSTLDRIPTILRTLVACGEFLYGNALDADIVRIHKHSFKITFLAYSSFSSSPLPRLVQRARVNLRTQHVDIFDHSRDGQILFFKERFVSFTGQENETVHALSTVLRDLGISEKTFYGPSAVELTKMLNLAGQTRLAETLELR
jgi:DNA phosphorothioation-associated putative methyltransferase